MSKLFALLFFIGSIRCADILAQKQTLNFVNILKEDENFEVYDIKKDKVGFIWSATMFGLYRYDGYNFKKFPTVLDSIHNGDVKVFGLFIDIYNILWAVTVEGLLKVNLKSGDSKLYVSQAIKNINDTKFCTALVGDNRGIIWVGTAENLYEFKISEERFFPVKYNPIFPGGIRSNHIENLFIDSRSDLWVCTSNGLFNYNSKENIFTLFKSEPNNQQSLSNNLINEILEVNGVFWISTAHGLNKFDPGTKKFKRFFFNEEEFNICSINKAQNGHLWISSLKNGIFDFDPLEGTFIKYCHNENGRLSLRNKNILTSYLDDTQLLWIGFANGIEMASLNKPKFKTYFIAHKARGVSGLCQDTLGCVWFVHEGILSALDLQSGKEVYRYENPDIFGDFSFCLTLAKDSCIWFSTFSPRKALRKFNPKTREYFIFSQNDSAGTSHQDVWTIYKDKNENLWIGGTDGLNIYEFKTSRFIKYLNNPKDSASISDNGVGPVCEDNNGFFWVGTLNGLNKFNPKTKKFERFYHNPFNENSINDNEIMALYNDQDNIWIGTKIGLSRYDKKHKIFKNYKIGDNFVLYIAKDKLGYLWITTRFSLIQFDPRTGNKKEFNNKEGLPKEFYIGNFASGPKGDLLFGFEQGIITFNPTQLELNKRIPPIVITDFKIFDHSVIAGKNSTLKGPISETKNINLSFKESYFTFEFAALNFIAPEKNQYAYRLEGFDQDWNYVANKRTASYANLDPGKYIFKVKGSNNDGVWNTKGISLTINIVPAFWQTWWFKFLILVGVTGLLFFVNAFRTRRIEKKYKAKEILKDQINRELEEKVKDRTDQLNEANQQIQKINELLQLDNKKLETDVRDIFKARVIQAAITFEEFEKIYPNEEVCYQYIYDIKWKNGYICRKCNNTKYSKGPIPYSLKCNKCSYIETVTANTTFNKLKFPIVKAMYLLAITKAGHKFTIRQLSETLDLRQATCNSFILKAKEAIAQTKAPKGKSDWGYLIHSGK